jgi:Zn-dependent protease with chaperone function
MNLALCLLAYTLSMTALGPALLSRATRDGSAPRLGVAAWLMAIGGVVAAVLVAFVVFTTQVALSWGRVGTLLTACAAGLGVIARGGYGDALQLGLLTLAATTATALGVFAARGALALRRAYRGTADHASAVRIAAGDTPPGPGGAFVIESRQRGVYCLAGRPETIVVTRAAMEVLNDAELAAVISHERAHLTGHHHRLLAVTGALSRALPAVRLFTDGAREIARLLEMCADDASARRHGPDTVVDALLALALPSPTTPTPSAVALAPSALHAAGSGVVQRVERLLVPPNQFRGRVGITLAIGSMLIGPVTMSGLMAATPMLCS